MPTTLHRSGGPKPVRFALVGCGRIAQSHIEALQGVPGAKLVIVVETREAAGRAAAEQNGCHLLTDFRDPQIPDLIDAAIICLPPALHHEAARHFLEAGVHVLCEKPLTVSSADAMELVRLSDAKGLTLMMASKFRYVDDVIKTKAITESGILGNIVLYENTFCSKVNMRDRWNSQKAVAGGGVLIDNGSHSVDIARYLLGPIKEVQAQNGIPAQGLEVEETVRLQFRTEGGVIGMVDLSWSISKESDVYISLYGSEGTLHVGWSGSRYRQDGNSKWVSFGAGYNKLHAFKKQIENFVGCVRGQALPLITPEDALASVQVIESAYVSAGKIHWVPVAQPVPQLA
ncbi:MAG: Gfo/Idh/MocA family oxidoreductase [Planctomycetes bacterium]|nr:Gfo/Idh/MocA family oxidoreductase [Planctomycetota bacterium]